MEATPSVAASAKPVARFRHSKFKHIYGKAAKREHCYDNIRVTTTNGHTESAICAVNPLYLAVIIDTVGGGSFLVLPLDRFGRVDRNPPLVSGHRAAVLDIQWCPHNDCCIASASEDGTAKVWLIGPDSFARGRPLTRCHRDLVGHSRRVNLLAWHPVASMVLLTAGADNRVLIWNADKQLILRDIAFPDVTLSCSFSWTGARFVCACRDRLVRLVDARTGEVLTQARLHAGTKPVQLVCLRDGRVFSTGFADSSGGRQWALWRGDNLELINRQNLDTNSSGVLLPLYDPDVGLIYLAGKGDCVVRYYELTNEPPHLHYLGAYLASETQRGVGAMPKRGLNIAACEIGRLYLLRQRGLCEPVSFIVPRRCSLFQADLYPDTRAAASALNADAWLAGAEAEPVLMPLTPTEASSKIACQLKESDEPTDSSIVTADKTNDAIKDVELHRVASTVSELSVRVLNLSNSVRLLAAESAELRHRVLELEAASACSQQCNYNSGKVQRDRFEDDTPSSEDCFMDCKDFV